MVSLNDDESMSSLRGLVTTQKLCHSNDQPLEVKLLRLCPLCQQYPTFLAPETSFVEDDFPKDWRQEGGVGFWLTLVDYVYCALYFYSVAISGYSALTLGLRLSFLEESNATTELTRGRAQVVI